MPRRKTDAEFKKGVFDLVEDEYTFLETYVNKYTKIRVRHNKCGHTYKAIPNNFLHGSRCPYCRGCIKTDAKFRQEVYDLVGNEYTFLDDYIKSSIKIKVRHNTCGYIYYVEPNNFLHGERCPKCVRAKVASHSVKTSEDFKKEVSMLVSDEYTFLDTYVHCNTKLRVKHNKCGNIYKVRPTDFISHHARCPYCNMPKTEKIIAKILDALNINYEIQKTFDDLKDKDYLSYDFYILDQNILIEYQGRQHYKPLDLYGGKDAFKIQQKHDKMKASYAKAHHYNLIAIPYTEDTFSKIKKYLIKHGLR